MVGLSYLARFSDPLVVYDLDGTRILLPLWHRLPVYRKIYPRYASNVARIARHVQSKYADMSLIDIGANVGDTVAILRREAYFPILCIEGDERFTAILQLNLQRFGGEVYLEQTFVSDTAGEFKGRVVFHHGTSELVRDERALSSVRTKTLVEIVQARPTFANARMIKIDTDGFDCRIIRNELELLSRLKPILFFEYDPAFYATDSPGSRAVFESLRAIGYACGLVYDNTGDYLLMADLADTALLEDIHHFYSGRDHQRYCDICAFHHDDSDLAEAIRRAELEFFDRLRGWGR